MRFELGELIYRITGDATGFTNEWNDAENQSKKNSKKISNSFNKIKLAAIAATTGLALFFKKAFNDAKQAQEVNQKFAVTFREVSKEAKSAASNLATNFGFAKTEAKELLSTTGDLLSGFEFTGSESLELSNKINILAADLASFSNIEGGVERASKALTAALVGEREQAKALGIVIREDAVIEEVARLGLEKSTGVALLRAKAQATYNIAVRQSQNAIGDFARSQDSTANVEKRLLAQTKDLRIEVGNELTPAMTELGLTFLDTGKDGGVIQKVLINAAKAVSFVVRSLGSLIEALNILNRKSDQEAINKGMDQYGAGIRRAKEEMTKLNITTIDQLKAQSKDDPRAKAVLDYYNSVQKAGKKIQGYSQDNADAIKSSADRLDDYQKKLWGTADAAEEIVETREKDKKLAEDALALEKKKKKANEDSTDEKKKELKTQDKINIGLEASIDILGGFITLLSAINEKRLNDLDIQEQRALEVAGVEEETAIERAERELEDARKAGDQDLIIEKQNAVEREKIYAEFDKKRAKAEYEGALLVWDLQVAQSIASGALAVSNALAAGALFGPVTAGVFAGIAGTAALLQTAAVVAAKPPPPKFEGGGIIPGTTSGTTVVAGENNQAEGIFSQAQMQRLLNIADGGGSGGQFQRVAPLSKEMMYDDLFEASQNGELFFSKKGVV